MLWEAFKNINSRLTNSFKKGKFWQSAFTLMNTIGKMLDSAKDRPNTKHHKGVYAIPCYCGKEYVRETGCLIQVRLKEHSADIVHHRSNKSVPAEYLCNTMYYAPYLLRGSNWDCNCRPLCKKICLRRCGDGEI